MKRRFYSFVLIFMLAVTGVFFSSTSQVSASENPNLEASAPDKIWVENLPNFDSQPEYMFYTTAAHGYLYRGYVEKYLSGFGYATYRGWLYRDPLPYPTPFKIPDKPSQY